MSALNKLKSCLALLLSVTVLFGSMPLEVAFVLAQDRAVFEEKPIDDEVEIDADLKEEGTIQDLDNGHADYDFIYSEYEYDKDHEMEVSEHQEDSDIELSLEIVASGSFPGENGAQWTLGADDVVRVEGGFISSSGIPTQSPWHDYTDNIEEIIFTEKVEATSDLSNLFRDLSNVTLIEGLEQIDTEKVTNMNSMFRGLSRLTTLNVSGFNTSNVESMYSMFRGTSDLTLIEGLEQFDTTNVRTMSAMFYGASRLTTLNLSGFNTRNVESMYSMFRDTRSLTSIEGLEQFDTTNVRNMSAMFLNANHLTYIKGLQQINTIKVENMSHMFRDASSLTTLNVSGLDTRRVTNMTSMFRNASSLTSIEGLEYVDTSSVQNMYSMFRGASSLTSIEGLEYVDTRNVTNMSAMFRDASSLKTLNLSTFNTRRVTDMSLMFSGASELTSLDLTSFDTSHTNMNNMFFETNSLQVLRLGRYFHFNTNAGLPEVPNNTEFTGAWQNVGGGTVENPIGEFVFTSAGLMANYDGSTMADTFVWQPVNRTLAINNVPKSSNPMGQTPSGEEWIPGTNVTIEAGESSSYTFLGWMRGEDAPTSGNIGDLEYVIEDISHTFTMPASNVTYTALWGNIEGEIGVPNNLYVTYIFHWGLEGVSNRTGEVRYNTAPSLPTDIPVNPGYRFDGWNPVVGPITEATTFEAIWTPIPGREPDLEPATEIDNEDKRVTPSPSGPRLPQTGAIVGSSILGGVALAATGVAIASKKRKDKK